MLRRATALLTRPVISLRARPFSTDVSEIPVADTSFYDAWKKVIPTLEPPHTPLTFMKPRPPTPSSIPTKLTVNFVLPYNSELAAKEVSLWKICCGFGAIFSFWCWI